MQFVAINLILTSLVAIFFVATSLLAFFYRCHNIDRNDLFFIARSANYHIFFVATSLVATFFFPLRHH